MAERQQDRKRSPAVAVGAGAAALAVIGGGLWLSEKIPHQVGTPQGSSISAKTLKILPVDFDCRSETVYDTQGSTARTEYRVNNHNLTFTGYGANMIQGKLVMEACSVDPSIQVVNNKGTASKLVKIKLSSMKFDSHFNEADTEVLPIDPPLTQAFGGAVDLLSAGARSACNLLGRITTEPKWCGAVNIVSQWNNTQQADLDRSLRVAVLQDTQKDCGPIEWTSEKAAITDAYKAQAVKQGASPNMVNVEFVDDSGNPTTATPDFTHSTLDQLYQDGTLDKNAKGSPQLKFSSITCTPLTHGYRPKYPTS